MRAPTERQRQAYEAVVRLGSQTVAAAELGRTAAQVGSSFRGYLEATGTPWPAHVRRYNGWSPDRPAVRIAALEARVLELEGMLASAFERYDALRAEATPLARLEAKLDQLLARPAGMVVASSRRITDGGEGEKHQRRRLSREASAA